jgi:enoyl-CoA hydratase/carnithine racemase
MTVEVSFAGSAGDGRVARVVVDNRARLNILDTDGMRRLRDAFRELAQDGELRAAVLTGAGDRAFIGGADITEMAGLQPDTATALITTLHEACLAVRELPVPVVARIRGYCLGAGLEVAASCDVRISDASGVFGMPETRVGIPSVIEAALLPRLVGWGRTSLLLYGGDTIDAERAERWGLVDELVPADALDNAVEAVIGAIRSAGPNAVRLQKRLIRRWEELPVGEAVRAGIPAFAEAWRSDEPRQRMKAFLDRRRAAKERAK